MGYNLPAEICHKLRISSFRVKLQVNNLFTWSKVGHNIDPETYGLNGGSRGMAAPKTYSIGASISF